jgi:uncharacterized protein YjbI with pentapeptide repeats
MHGKSSNAFDLDAAILAHEKYVLGYTGGIRADLKFLRAPEVDLSNCRLDDIELSGADLQEANLAHANLTRASLNCASIVRANLFGAILHHADLRGARIQGANFEHADMDGADFRQATIALIDRNGKWSAPGTERGTPFVSFANCSLRGARLNNANLKNAKFDGALLNEVSFAGAVLDNATFEGAVMVGVNFKELRVDPARLRNCIVDPTLFSQSRLSRCLAILDESQKWARTNGREGQPASFEGEDIRLLARHMRERALTGINLKRTIAVNTDFTGCELQAAKFDAADLRGANFSGADLRGASFAGANLAHANFTGANLLPLVLESGQKIQTNFQDALLDRANFSEAKGRRASDLRRGALIS